MLQCLMLAGLVQLKSPMNGSRDGRVSVTTELDVSLPDMLKKGAFVAVNSIHRQGFLKAN